METNPAAQWFRDEAERLRGLVPKPPLMMERAEESPTERAAWNVDLAVADLILAVTQCQTTDEALTLHAFMIPLVLRIQAAESAALHKADELSGASR